MTISANFPNVQPSLLLDFANAKQLPPQVTFTRATTAAYYDGSTTAMAEQNLFLSSQAFGSWSINGATLTTGVTDPAGGTTAATVTKTASDSWSLRRDPSVNTRGTTFTMSFYLKGSGTVTLRADNYVDQALTQQVTLSATWTRYSFTFTFNNNGNQTVGAFGIGMTSGDTATSFDVAFAQLEYRSSATAYTATTTQAITNYIPVLLTAGGGQPRFDHNPTTSESLGLLIEEQRTNLLSYSNTLFNWGSIGSQASGTTIVPSGELSGVNANRTGPNNLYTIISVSNATTYTFSVYAKAGFGSQVNFGVESGFGTYAVVGFNLSSGIAPSPPSGTTVSMTSVGNGWYRLTMTGTTTSTSVTLHIAATTADYTNGVWVWGAQLETGAFATSYIPTTGASATRAADAAVMTRNNLTSWFNNSEGTLYGEASFPASAAGGGASKGVANLGNTVGPTQNSMALYYSPTLSQSTFEVVNGTAQATFNVNFFNRLAGAYKFNDSNLGYGGSSGTTDTSCTIPVCDQFVIGNVYSSTQIYHTNGWIRKIAYYPVRVTNAQLQALTA